MEAKGLFDSLYADRSWHYWHTPKASRKVDKGSPTQFARAMAELGIEMTAGYSRQAQGRSERLFGTLQVRMLQQTGEGGRHGGGGDERVPGGILATLQRLVHRGAEGAGARVLPPGAVDEGEIARRLCVKTERTVGNYNCVAYKGRTLQHPPQPHGCHYLRAEVPVHEYKDGATAVFHRTLGLGPYEATGRLQDRAAAAAVNRLRRPTKARFARLVGSAQPSGQLTCSEDRPFYLLPTSNHNGSCRSQFRSYVLRTELSKPRPSNGETVMKTRSIIILPALCLCSILVSAPAVSASVVSATVAIEQAEVPAVELSSVPAEIVSAPLPLCSDAPHYSPIPHCWVLEAAASITCAAFAFDVLVPDPVIAIDEILLGAACAVLLDEIVDNGC